MILPKYATLLHLEYKLKILPKYTTLLVYIATCLFEPVKDAGDPEVRRCAAPDGADRGHGRHDLDGLGAVRDVAGERKKSCSFQGAYSVGSQISQHQNG